ncbi:MAG TPA: muconolactone Delta-isomerase family protein [Solirubrobacteraceae bacterium]
MSESAEGSPLRELILGLYRADTEAQLTDLLRALPLYDWMNITVTPLEAHPNDPGPPANSAAR